MANQNNTFNIKYYRHSSIANPIQNEQVGNDVKIHRITVQLRNLTLLMPNHHNAREAKINKSFHKEMRNSIINPDVSDFTQGLFNLRNSGITIVAENAQIIDQNILAINFGTRGSIIDGGHTYKILSSIIEDYNNKIIECIPEEYVNIEVITGLNKSVISEITEARNTSQKHQLISLINQSGKLEWLKNAIDHKDAEGKQIKGMPDSRQYSDKISWYQNDGTEDNEKLILDASYIIQIISTCDIIDYPNAIRHPIKAYNSKEVTVENFANKPENFKSMHDMVATICELHDYIIANARIWNKTYQNVFIDKKKYKEKLMFLSGKQLQELSGRNMVLHPAFAFPILSALRQLLKVIETDEGKKIIWKDGYNFSKVVQMLDEGLGQLLVECAHEIMSETPVINAIIKKDSIYSKMYGVVGEYVRDNS